MALFLTLLFFSGGCGSNGKKAGTRAPSTNGGTQQSDGFDPKSIQNTARWINNETEKLTRVEEKENQIRTRQATEAMNRTLATAVGKKVRWKSRVERVSENRVFLTLQSDFDAAYPAKVFRTSDGAYGSPVSFGVFLDDGPEYSFDTSLNSPPLRRGDSANINGFPITPQQARTLVSGDILTFTGRVQRCEKSKFGFLLNIVQAKIVE